MTQVWNVPTIVGTPESQAWQNAHDALEALRTMHAGPSEPAAMAAYMLWFNTTSGRMQMRNSANSGWLDLFGVGASGSVFRQVVEGWYRDNVLASESDSQLTRSIGGSFASAWVAPRAGSVIGLSILSNEARTAGTLTAEVFINAGPTGFVVVLDGTNTTFHSASQAAGLDTFAAGVGVDVRITTTGAWAPTTADIRASIEVEM